MIDDNSNIAEITPEENVLIPEIELPVEIPEETIIEPIIKTVEIPQCKGIENVEFDFVGKYIAISSGNSYIFNTKSSELIDLDNTMDCNYMKFDRDMEHILSVSSSGNMNVNLLYSN